MEVGEDLYSVNAMHNLAQDVSVLFNENKHFKAVKILKNAQFCWGRLVSISKYVKSMAELEINLCVASENFQLSAQEANLFKKL